MNVRLNKMGSVLKITAVMLVLLVSLFCGKTDDIKAAESYYNGYGHGGSHGTSTATGAILSGSVPANGNGYGNYYMHHTLGWPFPTSWKLFQDSTGTWCSFYWDGDPLGYYLKNAWFQVNGNWFFANCDGYLVKGWAYIPRGGEFASTDCGWFYFDENGIMQEGWQYVNNHWYYFNLSDVEADSSAKYEWGECLYDTDAIPHLNTVANSDLSWGGKTARYVTGFTFYTNVYLENDAGGHTLLSSTPKVCNLGSSSSCSMTVEAPAQNGYTFNAEKSSPGTVTNSLYLVENGTLATSLTKTDANWYYNRKTSILYLNPNGGTLPTQFDNVTVKYLMDTYNDLSWNIPIRSGYSFNGWYTKTSSGTKIYGADGKVTNDETYWKNGKSVYTSDYTLYAQWSAKKYTVTYDANGGTLTSGSATASVAYGSAVSLAPKATKEGMLFAGWGLSPTDKLPLSSYTMPAGNVTLYALYSLPVSDMKEAVLVSWSIKNPSVYNSFPMTLTKTDNGKYDYSLSGINLKKGLTYSSDADIMVALVLYDNATNYRVIPIKGTNPPPIPNPYPQTVKHYLWNKEANKWVFYASTTEIAYKNSTYTPKYLETLPSGYHAHSIDGAYKVTGPTEKSAFYMPNEYTLYFKPNGGSCDTPSKTVYKDYFYGDLPIATREGYSFVGWYTDAKKGTMIHSSDRYPYAGDSTVYAHWTINKYNVIYEYKTNGGDGVDITYKEVNYKSPVDLSPKAYKNGWEFVGWNTDPKATTAMSSTSSWQCETCGKAHTLSSMPSHDIVLYAIYKKDINLTVIESTDDGQKQRTLSKTIYNIEREASFTMTEENTWTGKELLGWTTGTAADEAPMVGIGNEFITAEDKTLYGLYTSTVTLAYDTNGSSMVIDPQTKETFFNASGSSKYPEFIIADKPTLSEHSFAYWQATSGSITDITGTPITSCVPEQTILVESDTVLTAKWDKRPQIEAYDRYFTLEEAQNEEITPEVLLEKVTGTDLEDGTLVNGTDVVVKDYDASDFTSLDTDTEVEITYQATDSFGNVVEKTITANITDTSMKKSRTKSYVRFISEEFFVDEAGNFVSVSAGGLEENSKWRKNSELYQLLKDVLMSDKTNVEVWSFSQEELKKMKKDL